MNLFLIPAGISEARTLHVPVGRYYAGASFFADGKQLLITTVCAPAKVRKRCSSIDSPNPIQSPGVFRA